MRGRCLATVRVALAYVALAYVAPAGGEEQLPTTLQAMQAELERSMAALADEPEPPYFVSYEITDMHTVSARASFGALVSSDERRTRVLDVDLRVGDYDLDNTRPLRDPDIFAGFRFGRVRVPVEDDPAALRTILWNETDHRYKAALEQLTKVRTDVEVKVEAEDTADDFSREDPVIGIETAAPMDVDIADWERRVKRYTLPFSAYGNIYGAEAQLSAFTETRWFANSDGSAIQAQETIYRLFIYANTKADDGMVLPLYKDYGSFTLAGLPDDDTVAQDVEWMIATLLALREAPLVDPYTGPAILSGQASGVFFHEVLGHRLEGHRQKDVDEGQTFRKKLGEPILPASFSVHFDPLRKSYGGHDLVGGYRYDNQGIRARRVTVVDRGTLKNFLMSRMPIDGFPHSNGHGRKQMGYQPVARQSNLIVEVDAPLTEDALKTRLLEAIKAEGKTFGLRIEDIQGGFTFTGRVIPNSFNVAPILVYRIHLDGREELVRGVDLIGTPLTAFSRVVAGGDRIAVFNGTCGAESGGVPVSAASPAILISQIEVQKKSKSQDRPPLLPPPVEVPSA